MTGMPRLVLIARSRCPGPGWPAGGRAQQAVVESLLAALDAGSNVGYLPVCDCRVNTAVVDHSERPVASSRRYRARTAVCRRPKTRHLVTERARVACW